MTTKAADPIPLPANKAEARIAVAKDVIEQVQSARYEPMKMTYVDLQLEGEVPAGVYDLRDVLGLPTRHCKVCALGSLVISRAKLFDRVPIERFRYVSPFATRTRPGHLATGDPSDLLSDIFSEKQLRLIEAAFERWDATTLGPTPEAQAFGSRFPDIADRLIAIMQNIVENGGEFRP